MQTVLLGGALLWSVGIARAQSHATGLKPMDAEEVARLRAQGQEIHQVLPNRVAWERMNAQRQARGLRALSVPAAALGQETVVGDAKAPDTLTAFSASALPTHVDNSALDFFPPIRSQGSIGSCVAWATTYYQLSHNTALANGWDAKHSVDNSRLFSPKWTYNFINNGEDLGSYFSSAYTLLRNQGATSWATLPYDSNYTAWPLDPAVWRGALPYRTNPVQMIYQVSTPTGLQQVKELLTNGYVLVYGTFISSWQSMTIKDDPSTPNDNAYVGKSVAYWLNGYVGSHAMTIVGYDDDIWTDVNKNNVVDPGEKGALRIANSWGTGWNEGGFTWLAYDALRWVSAVTGGPSAGRVAALQSDVVYHLAVRPAYTPTYVAELTVNHAKRDQLMFSLGVSDPASGVPTVWNSTAFTYAGGPRSFNGSTTAAVDGPLVFDFTDLVPASLAPRSFYVKLYDRTTGDPAVVKSFKLVDSSTGGTTVASTETPMTVDMTTGYVHADYTPTNHRPLISSASPVGRVKLPPGGSVALQVNASDEDGQSLSYAWSVDGVSVPESTSGFTYAPTVVGPHSVRAVVSDGVGGSTAQVFNVVLNAKPLATSQSLTLTEDSTKAVALTAFDADGDPLSLTVVDAPLHGSLSGPLPSPLYRPEANFFGSDSFTFLANDGTEDSPLAVVTFNITPVNDAPTSRITSPVNGVSIPAPGTVTLEVAASDVEGPIAKVELYQGGVKVAESATEPYRFTVTGLVAGSYGFVAKAYDGTGVVTSSSTVTVNVLAPTVSVGVSDATSSEPGTDTGRFLISRSGGVAGQVLTVGYTLTGTAANGVDFAPLSGTVTLGAGVTSVNVDVLPVDDALVEGKETVVLTLVPDATYKVGTVASGTVTLLDNEQSVVTVALTDSVASEPGTDTAKFTVTRTGPTTAPLTVRYAMSGTATAGTDYTDLPGTVTIGAGLVSASVVLTPLDDALVEGRETAVMTLQEDAAYQVHTSASATAYLLDDEMPVITLSATDGTAAEPSDPGVFTVTRTGPTTDPLTVLVSVSSTATAGSDYQALPTSVVIPAGSASATLTVQPVDDALVEGRETVTLTLVADAAYQLTPTVASTVYLYDDEKPELRLSVTDSSASEPGTNGGLFTVTSVPAPSTDLSIPLTVTGTATPGTDYVAISAPLTLPAGVATVTVPVTPLDDTVKESTETVVVTIPAGTAYTLGTASGTVSVTDND
ncbi:PKD domain-containing protein [Myxococcaceae bacterium JPH2]|nr:PKD domain-containing protein [Myxococcaceae bacterium JPH2]